MYGLYLQVEGRICVRYDSDGFTPGKLRIEMLEDEVGLVGGVADEPANRNQLPCNVGITPTDWKATRAF